MTTVSERLLTTFLGELQERLSAFEQDLLALEGVTSDDDATSSSTGSSARPTV